MAASQSGVFNAQQFTDAGLPAASYRLYTYTQGTTTHKAAYTDAAGVVPHTYTSDGSGGQYIALNARGELPAPLFLASGTYDIALKTPAGATVWTRYARGAADYSAAVETALRASLASTASASDGAGLPAFSYALNYAAGTIGGVVRAFGIDMTQPPFNCDKTNASDCSSAANLALSSYPGIPLIFPAGTYRFDATVSVKGSPTWSVFGIGAIIRGAGVGATFFDNRVANGPLFYVDSDSHGGSYHANMGTVFEHFNIMTTTSPAASTGIRVLNGYQVTINNVSIRGMTQDGIELKNGAYADDGWNRVTINQVWIETCARWGIKADGSPGRNEGSFTVLENVFFQTCGTVEVPCSWTATIAGTTMTVSAVASGSLVIGRRIVAAGVDGDTIIEQQLTGSAGSTGTYRLSIDGAATSQTVASATAMHDAPNSGAMIWKGQVLTIDSCGAANGNQNVALFIKGGAGLGVNVDIRGWVSENTVGRGLYCTGVSNLRMRNCQIYNNIYHGTTQVEFEGAQYVVRNVDIDGVVIRATSGNNPITAFKLSGANADASSCRVRNVTWDDFDYTGQTRFNGWQFDAVPIQCEFAALTTTSAALRPKAAIGGGNKMPYRLRGGGGGTPSTTGEWVAHEIASGGLSITNSALSNSTRYYCYLYDNIGFNALELSTTAFTTDTGTGYPVKTGDATRLYVGSIETDAGGLFKLTGGGWLNPVLVPGTQVGVPTYMWCDSTNRLRVKATAPSSDTDGTVVGTQV